MISPTAHKSFMRMFARSSSRGGYASEHVSSQFVCDRNLKIGMLPNQAGINFRAAGSIHHFTAYIRVYSFVELPAPEVLTLVVQGIPVVRNVALG